MTASAVMKRRREPVFLLPLVEHDLQRADADREHADAPVVDLAASRVCRYGGSKMYSFVITSEAMPTGMLM